LIYPHTEDQLVEQPAIQLIQHVLRRDVVNCYGEWALLRPAQRDEVGHDGGAIEGAVEH
jgi:hypothetical protein